MTTFAHETLLVPLLVFCRVGACFMLLPGFSSDRIPVQLRLFVAFAVSLALSPLVYDSVRPATGEAPSNLLAMIVVETSTGILLGFLVRIIFMALEFAATCMANYAGYGSVFSHSVENNDPSSPFASLVTTPAVALFFITNQHVNIILMLQRSYETFKVGLSIASPPNLQMIVGLVGSAFKLTLQLSAALVVYSITINLAFGFLNKMVPQIPIYFVSTPFVVLGGLFLLLQIDKTALEIFSSLVSQAIQNLGANG
ncbi:flagellar biosynthetic protein FliR [Hyphomicrobium sp. 99]|uniref:flagellar biosynthetic protein FliR n=1 Tax=Hyphomicrobium sp. 99 TaxID=1163419 RepID=UPI0005F78AE0|nr:flagellar biosynthetic protein FliR [Hyphomicrobium sp. 99]